MRRIAALALLAILTVAEPGWAADGDGTKGTPNGDGSTGYAERYVFAGFTIPPVEVATPARGGTYQPTHFCLHLPLGAGIAVVENVRGDELRAYVRTLTDTDFGGSLRNLVCFRAGNQRAYYTAVITYDPTDPTAGQITTIDTVVRYARRLVSVSAPTVRTSPPAARLIVGFATWFDTTADTPAPRSAQAGPLWATARAIPRSIELVPETGVPPRTCPITDAVVRCMHTYLDIDRATGLRTTIATVRVVYDVELVTSDNPFPRVVDTITSDPAEVAVTIREIQTVLR